MSGGESDAIKFAVEAVYIPVDTSNTPAPVEYKSADLKNTSTTSNSFQLTGSTAVYPWYWYGSTTVYKYQVKCPIKTCKRMNWLELDKITPCFECGCKLKAVSQIADYEIEINI